MPLGVPSVEFPNTIEEAREWGAPEARFRIEMSSLKECSKAQGVEGPGFGMPIAARGAQTQFASK
jgi:hypothetical protein